MAELPKFSIGDIERRRNRLARDVFASRVGEIISGAELTRMCGELKRLMPSYVSRDSLFESIRSLAGVPLTDAVAMQTAWRLAGNLPRLKAGFPVPPWATQSEEEWIPLQIMRAVPFRNQRNKSGYNFSFLVLAGSPCPMRITTFWTVQMVRLVASKIGFSFKRASQYQFHQGTELVGLRLLGKLDPLRSRYEPNFWEVDFPDSFVKWNRDNVLRQRLHIIPCPNRYTEPCRRCAVGYDNCIGSTHKRDYVCQFCTYCRKDNMWFDPEYGMDKCIDCTIKQLTTRR